MMDCGNWTVHNLFARPLASPPDSTKPLKALLKKRKSRWRGWFATPRNVMSLIGGRFLATREHSALWTPYHLNVARKSWPKSARRTRGRNCWFGRPCSRSAIDTGCTAGICLVVRTSFFRRGARSFSSMAVSGTGMSAVSLPECRNPALSSGRQSWNPIASATCEVHTPADHPAGKAQCTSPCHAAFPADCDTPRST